MSTVFAFFLLTAGFLLGWTIALAWNLKSIKGQVRKEYNRVFGTNHQP
jgi:hypothetical protein